MTSRTGACGPAGSETTTCVARRGNSARSRWARPVRSSAYETSVTARTASPTAGSETESRLPTTPTAACAAHAAGHCGRTQCGSSRAARPRARADALGDRDGRPLYGVPVAIKDDQDVAGEPTCFGTAVIRQPAAADSEIVRRLREAGAIVIGKTHVPELTIWPWTESDAFGVTRNPWDPACT